MSLNLNTAFKAVRNEIVSRTQFFRNLLNTRRDLDAEFGYPDQISIEDYKKKFKRGDIAHRIICVYPNGCWRRPPEIYETEETEETEFERAWKSLEQKFRLHSIFQRADILSGIGQFGIILLGIDDGKPLNEAIEGISPEGKAASELGYSLLYIRPFDQSYVKIKKLESDVSNPRYGLPTLYEIQFAADQLQGGTSMAPQQGTGESTTKEVHWTRVIHLADNRLSDEVFGTPRLERAYNRVLDLHKIAGGSPEMFYKGGYPGTVFETQATDEPITIDKEATKEEIQSFFEGMQRHLLLEGMTAKNLLPNISDPAPHAELQIRLIAIALEIPWRILMGAEVGQLASGQDIIAWNEQLNRRREDYVAPYVIRPVVDRFIMLGILPKPSSAESTEDREVADPEYIIYWDDLNTPSSDQIADVADKLTSAIQKYLAGGCDQLIDPRHYLTEILKLNDELADAIMEEVGDRLIETDPDAELERDVERAERMAEVEARFTPTTPNPSRNATRS